MAQQHAELGAPITNVVDAKDVVPTTGQDTADRLTDDGRTQMAHLCEEERREKKREERRERRERREERREK